MGYTSPASGSYNPAVLTEQSVTLNGTVTCPSNIDQNGVTLTTTIPVTGTAGKRISTTIKAIAVKSGTEQQCYKCDLCNRVTPACGSSTYAVTVNNGTGDGSYAAGATVTITADTTPTYTITAGAGGTHELSTDGTLSITCDGALIN